MDTKTISIIVAAVLVVASIAVWAIWFRPAPVIDQVGQIGGEILEKAQNPIKNDIVEADPFKKVEANPFNKNLNPYEGVYQNPFNK